MQTERRCSQCGRIIPWGQVECPLCAPHAGLFWSLREETFLGLTLLLLLILFAATGFAAKFYHAKEQALGQEWFSRGEAELRAGHAKATLGDFRTALAYSRENESYRLRLAQALVAAGQLQEGRTYLLSLWEREPGSGTINLELAHLAVREGSEPDALRYFNNAIYGEWSSEPVVRRRQTRLELAEYLLNAGDKTRAQSELLALAADLPDDAQLQAQVGSLLFRTGANDQALYLFQQALREDPRLEAALAGVGEAYFEMNDFGGAERYLSRAVAENPHLTRAASLLEVSRMVLSIDPMQRRLSSHDRAQRTLQAFVQVLTRLQECATVRGIDLDAPGGETDLHELYARALELEPRMREERLRRDPELAATAVDLVFEIEKTTARDCGEPQGLDLALLLLARAQGGSRP